MNGLFDIMEISICLSTQNLQELCIMEWINTHEEKKKEFEYGKKERIADDLQKKFDQNY